ncbi:M1 family metallopeptidase [Nitrosomonas marina]|uniref:Aminopeptidase N n=1 Tax=Nitrosomonas marina TaxID=917 RepID=A0A1H8GX01_9PROT|nr:M1 family aminopeptidase [Nitrosomonas marina]SEN48340.1 Aminopeptidase N [Nitrosomonas marina]
MLNIQTIRLISFFVLSYFINSTSAASIPGSDISHEGSIVYNIAVNIDPSTRMLEGKSVITFNKTREHTLLLDKQFEVTQAFIDDMPYAPQTDSEQSHYWQIPYTILRPHRIEIHWRGKLHPLDEAIDHEQTLGRPIAVSGEAGTFLPDAANWYPRVANGLVRYTLQMTLPAGQRGLVPGKLIDEQDEDTGYRARFEFNHPAGGIDLMAGPYEIESDHYSGIKNSPIRLRTYFHPQISQLADDYLATVKRYFELYESWIGAYPYTEFSIVSSPTPTGFGMPTLTYLGINVLRLPFIKNTSLGHEVLHNWWGNGVYPDYKSGNWSEGLTTFMADYTYKEQESAKAAREMRQGWLRDFAALEPGQDAPLTAFTSRTHGASKIVGYHKAAMFFFMLRDLIGDELFNRSIQGLWNMQRFKVTTWSNLQSIFEIISAQDLSFFFDQWLNRTGAPSLTITEAWQEPTDFGHRLHITLQQPEPAYQLRVPVAILTDEGEKSHLLDLQQTMQTFTLDLSEKTQSVILDPDTRLFRLLAPGEALPILREVMVNPTTTTVILSDNDETQQTAAALAEKLQRRTPKILTADQFLTGSPTLVIGLQHEIDAWLESRGLPEKPEEVLEKGTAQIWTLTGPEDSPMVIVSAQDKVSLEALIRPLPHYGRQSYIVFDGRQAVKKGVWPMQVQQVKIK